MTKVLAQAGISLADIYEVEGSIAGVDQLISEEVHLLHEMGGVIFSERLIGQLARVTTGAIAQNLSSDQTFEAPPDIYRVLGVYVQADVPGRTARAQVSLRDPTTGREIPIFVWDSTNDVETVIRLIEDGTLDDNASALVQTSPQVMPSMGIGTGQRLRVGEEIVFRPVSSGFGAGTVTITALVYLASSTVSGVGSHGLPIPAW